jgi:hypothetical protein
MQYRRRSAVHGRLPGSPPAPPSKASTSGPEIIGQALGCLRAGRLEQAETLCRGLLGAGSTEVQALHLLAIASARQNWLEEAVISAVSAALSVCV